MFQYEFEGQKNTMSQLNSQAERILFYLAIQFLNLLNETHMH